jgi:PRTRC genetic system protein B
MTVTSYVGDAQSSLRLDKALLIYREEGLNEEFSIRGSGGDEQVRMLVSIHEIARRGDKATIGPGQLLGRETLDSILRDMQAREERVERKLISPQLLFQDNTMLLWYSAACVRPIYYSTADKQFEKDVNGKAVAHPPLLFMAQPGMLYTWALKENSRPDAGTKACIAPYWNLYSNGAMCRGDVKVPGTLLPSTIPDWEKIFYDSRFTHSNLHSGKSTTHKGGHHGLWREMVGKEIFDSKYLVATKLTVGDILAGKTEP